jgi:hypothetical protein
MEIAEHELRLIHLRPSSVQHLRRAIHTDYLMSLTSEIGGSSTRAARRIENNPWRLGIEDLVHDRFVEVEEVVTWFVVGLRPLVVGSRCLAWSHNDPWVVRERLVGKQPPDLCEACLHECLVVVAGPTPQ